MTGDNLVYCQECGHQIDDHERLPHLEVGAYLCRNCTNRLRNVLDSLLEAWAESTLTLTRQTKTGSAGGKAKGHTTPLPFNETMSERRDEATTVARAWAVSIMHGHTTSYNTRFPDYIRTIQGRLAAAPFWHEAAAMLDELTGTLHRLTQPTDRAPSRNYLGHCECGFEVWAEDEQLHMKCPGCSITIDLYQHREKLLHQLDDKIATPSEIAGICRTLLGDTITSDTIRQWAKRRKITQRGNGLTLKGQTVPAYRVGDVLDYADQIAAKRRRTA